MPCSQAGQRTACWWQTSDTLRWRTPPQYPRTDPFTKSGLIRTARCSLSKTLTYDQSPVVMCRTVGGYHHPGTRTVFLPASFNIAGYNPPASTGKLPVTVRCPSSHYLYNTETSRQTGEDGFSLPKKTHKWKRFNHPV